MKTSQEKLDEFIYIVSHDVRADIRALRELPIWIRDDITSAGYSLSQDILENLDLLTDRAKRLDRMMCGLLKYSRAGQSACSQRVEISKALAQAFEKIGPTPNFATEVDFEDSHVWIAEADLTTMFECLLENAIGHHDCESGKISISQRRTEDGLVIEVADDGPGIDEDQKENALKVMTQLQSNRKNCGGGMGLAICKKITDHYRGTLSLSDSLGTRGLRVSARFPESDMSAA